MRIVVTGSSGHLGEALVRVLAADGEDVIGLDVRASSDTRVVGSITNRSELRQSLQGAEAVIHTATLHKPHIETHDDTAFVETNVIGTLIVLEECAAAGVRRLVFTSSTSAFGRALTPPAAEPAAWITEDVVPRPRNIYGVTKTAAEDLCELFHREGRLSCLVLRTSRFFPEADDDDDTSASFDLLNHKVNELLYRRVDLHDVVTAHRAALDSDLGHFVRYVVSATTPFSPADLSELRSDAPRVVRRLYPEYEQLFSHRGWTMSPTIDRVYVNARARQDLGWRPTYDFRHALDSLAAGQDPRSALALQVGAKGYHEKATGV